MGTDPQHRLSPSLWRVGETLSTGQRIERIIESGGMGTVYVVVSLETGTAWAVKTFKHSLFRDESVVLRFKEEAMRWIQLGRHPHIVYADQVFEIEGRPFIFLEFVAGPTLRELLQPALALSKVLRYGLQFCEGMDYCHSLENRHQAGLLHADIKPENCLIDEHDNLKITDFGLAMAIQPELSSSADAGGVLGTPLYMSPEHFLGREGLTIQSDVYSFGVLLFEMVSGARPFEPRGENLGSNARELQRMHRSVEPPRLASLVPGAPGALEDLILACLAKLPPSRPSDFGEIHSVLRSIQRKAMGRDHRSTKPASGDGLEQLRLAKSLVELGEYDEACRQAREAFNSLSDKEDQASAANAEGLSHLFRGNAQSARDLFETAVGIFPDSVEAWSNLALAMRALGAEAEALQACETALGVEAGHYPAWHTKGIILDEMGRPSEALACFARSLEINPRHVNSLASSGKVLLAEGRTREAREALVSSLSLNPRDKASLTNLAAVRIAEGRFDEALGVLAKLLEIDRKNAVGWHNYAAALVGLERFDEALDALRSARRNGLEEVEVLELEIQLLADRIETRREPELSQQLLEACHVLGRVDPDNAVLAPLVELMGTDKHYSIGPSEAMSLNLRGEQLLNWQGDAEKALRFFEEAIRYDPNLMDPYNNMGVALENLGRREEARGFYEKAIERQPDFFLSWFNLGNCVRDLGQIEEALGLFERASALNPDFPGAWVNQGTCLIRLSRLEEAAKILEHALEVDPRSGSARRALAKVETLRGRSR